MKNITTNTQMNNEKETLQFSHGVSRGVKA